MRLTWTTGGPKKRPVRVRAMRISVTEAKAQLTELVRRAEAGEEVVLTRHGRAAVCFTPVIPAKSAEERRRIIEAVVATCPARGEAGPSAAHSQDFLYDDDGLPA